MRKKKKSKRNIKIARVLNSARLGTLIQQNCCSEITKDPQVKLLVVDSVTSLYRAEYGDRSMLSQRQHQLLKIMHTLRNIAQVYNVAIVITNQIQNNLGELGYNYDKPVGGNVMARTRAFRISLGGSNPDKMSAKLMTSPCYPQDNIIRFAINDRGITDVTDD